MTYEWWDILEAVNISLFGERGFVPQDERDFDDSGQTSSHQTVSENSMDHIAEREMLRVTRHGPTGDENDKSRNEVPLWRSVSLPAQPNTGQTCGPPDDTHRCMLNIICNPWASPSMFRESVDASPCSNHGRVEELLRASGLLQPYLSGQHENGENDTVPDERTTHDEMSKTLAQVIISTEAQGSNSTK